MSDSGVSSRLTHSADKLQDAITQLEALREAAGHVGLSKVQAACHELLVKIRMSRI